MSKQSHRLNPSLFEQARNKFINRTPLTSRLPWVPLAGSELAREDGSTLLTQRIIHAYDEGLGPFRDLGRGRWYAIQHCFDDFETHAIYGRGGKHQGRPMMSGLASLLTTNKTNCPENSDNYGPLDLERDTIVKCEKGGGHADGLLLSTDYVGAFLGWGTPLKPGGPGDPAFVMYADGIRGPLGTIPIIFAPLLRPGTAICLSSAEVCLAILDPLIERPGEVAGIRGADIILGGCIVIGDEAHHAYVDGVTRYRVK